MLKLLELWANNAYQAQKGRIMGFQPVKRLLALNFAQEGRMMGLTEYIKFDNNEA